MAAFLATPRPDLPALLGNQVIARGELAVIAGKPGSGKTWLALDLIRAWITGTPWMGLETAPEGVNVGLLSLELSDRSLAERLHALGFDRPAKASCTVLTAAALGGVVDLNPLEKENDVSALISLITEHRLAAVVIDALARASTLPEMDLKPLLRGLDRVRAETGAAVILLHHERKGDPRETGAGDDLDAFRGDSALVAFATCCMRVTTFAGSRVVRFAKVTNGRSPDPLYFDLSPDTGAPRPAQAPQDAAAAKLSRNRAAVEQIVLDAGPAGADLTVCQKQSGLSRKTTATHIADMEDSGTLVRIRKGSRVPDLFVHATFSCSVAAPARQLDVLPSVGDYDASG